MLKIIVSLYIGIILLAAGFAKANIHQDAAALTAHVQRGDQLTLPISALSLDEATDVVMLSGPTPSPCIENVTPVLSLSRDFRTLKIYVVSKNEPCMSPLAVLGKYKVAIDLKAYFAEYNVSDLTTINVEIHNTHSGTKSFEYDILPQSFYQFDTHTSGVVEKDLRTNTFYLSKNDSRIEILSRFDLHQFENKFVKIKGLIPTQVGFGSDEAPDKLIIGQLVSL